MLDGLWFSAARRGLFEPLYHAFKRTPFLDYWKEQEKSQYQAEEKLRRTQWERLENLLLYVWESNSFYRDRFEKAGITPKSISSPENMRMIPILTKDVIRKNTPRMISSGFKTGDLLHFKTGGSTGKSLDIFITEECSYLRNACARRHDRWTGWEVGEPIAAVWGNPKLPVSIKDKLIQCFISPLINLDTMSVTENSVRAFAREWNLVKPTLLFGHAHSIYILAQYVRGMNLSKIRPTGILSTSMMLMPHERKVIEEVFGVKVTDRYGCEEVSLIASECERHEGMHLNIEHLFIEFVKDDGSYAGPGEPGNIVVTDLMNRAMPFVRYRVEDVGIPLNRQCSCGRGMPLMGKVTGRVADFLIKKDGTKVAGISLIENTLTFMPGLDQMQIVQEDLEHICLNIVPGKDYTTNVGNSLAGYFKDVFGKDVQVQLQLVAEIQPEKSGKYRFSICRIAQ